MAKLTNFEDLGAIKGLKLIHLNIRSLLPKIDQLRVALLNNPVDIITLSETWLNPKLDSAVVAIPGYKQYRLDRKGPCKKERGGGLLIYVKNSLALEIKELTHLNSLNGDLECQWIEIEREHARNVLICNLYRPPTGTVKEVFLALNTTIAAIKVNKKDLFILGDFNIDYTNLNSPARKHLTLFEKVNNLTQHIKTATRATKNTSTLLDLILTNAQYISQSGILDVFISDHLPIFIVKKKHKSPKQTESYIGRPYKSYNHELLTTNLKESDWGDFYRMENVNDKWALMHDKIRSELDAQCPLKQFRKRIVRPPYLTDSLLEQIKDRDYYYKKAKKHGIDNDWEIAKYLRNQTNKNIRKAKAEYVINQLELCKEDSSRFWRTINSVFPSKLHEKVNIKLNKDKEEVPSEDTADYINDFFINVGNPITTNTHSYQPVADGLNTNLETPTLDFDQVTQAEVFRISEQLNVNKSSGITNINAQVIKDSLLALNGQFAHILNTSLNTCNFPDDWKKAKVVPIPKGGDPTNVGNYRPISLLPAPGKVLEKIVHDQIEDFAEDEELLTEHQYGFRKQRSTLQAITQLLGHVNSKMNVGSSTVALFIDFRKAFDCLQYPILLAKIKALNFSQQIVDWLEDYLNNRSQSVAANGGTSTPRCIKQGVPQGSILGPLLYLMYANDIANIISKSKFTLCADDTVIYSSSKDITKAIANIQSDLNNLENWCKQNSIFINHNKTKYIIFSASKIDHDHLNLTVGDTEVQQVSQFSYLGVILDEHLTFKNHAQHTINRVSAKVYQPKKMRKFLSIRAALLIYKNMILPILEYGDIFLLSAPKKLRSSLQKLQNKALKCALGKDKRYNTNTLHKEAKLLKVKHRRKIHLLEHYFRLSRLPNFKDWKKKPKISTRSSKKRLMAINKPNTTKYQNSIFYKGPKAWNALPSELQHADNLNAFKPKLKNHLTLKWERKALRKEQR